MIRIHLCQRNFPVFSFSLAVLNVSLPGLVDVEEISVLVVSSLMPAVSHSLHRSPYQLSRLLLSSFIPLHLRCSGRLLHSLLLQIHVFTHPLPNPPNLLLLQLYSSIPLFLRPLLRSPSWFKKYTWSLQLLSPTNFLSASSSTPPRVTSPASMTFR